MTTRNLQRLAHASALGLIIIGAMCVLGNQGALLIQPSDPLTGVSSRYVFWAGGAFCLALGGVRLLAPGAVWAQLLAIWLVTSAAMFRLGLWYMGVPRVGPYFDTMGASFGLAPGLCGWLMAVGLALVFGSSVAVLQAASRVKTFCPNCGGHLEVAAKALGQRQPCAHCGQLITLRAGSRIAQDHVLLLSGGHAVEKNRLPLRWGETLGGGGGG